LPVDDSLFREAGARIDRVDEVLILSHHRPDGDAIGSTVAARAVLRQRGKRVPAFLLDPVPQRYRKLVGNGPIEVWDPAVHGTHLERAQAVLVLDTASWLQLEAVQDPLRRVEDRVIVVDHHQTQDGLGGLQLIDRTAAATGLLLYEWFCALAWPMPRIAQDGLFAALATDTGWFRFSNADARAMRAAAELVQAGVASHEVYEAIYWSESAARIALTTRALDSLRLYANDRLAVMQLDQACFRDCHAERSDSEDLINEPMRIGSVLVSVFLVEQPDGRVRVSLRSKGQVDVAGLAARWGGGGHARAAGYRADGPMAAANAAIVDILGETLAQLAPEP